MRSSWQQVEKATASKAAINAMCQAIFGHSEYKNHRILTAGRSHENHYLEFSNGLAVILRITNDQRKLQKQHGLAQKLWRKLPVARFISDVKQNIDGNYFAALEFLPGHRLANLECLNHSDQAQLGFELGEYLAQIHSQKFKIAGEFSRDLIVSKTYDISPNGLSEIFKNTLHIAAKIGYISLSEAKKYTLIFKTKITIFDDWQHQPCLTHCDLNEDNILHHQGHISAILDWEFAIAGHPALDFGKLTRSPYSNCVIFVENLCDSYYLTHKNLPPNWHEIAALVDLLAWAEFLSRPKLNPDIKNSAINKLQILLK